MVWAHNKSLRFDNKTLRLAKMILQGTAQGGGGGGGGGGEREKERQTEKKDMVRQHNRMDRIRVGCSPSKG